MEDDVVVGTQLDDSQDQGTPEGTPQDQPFLAVNDRVSYKTKEDAVKAYDEAGKRIAALSKWEKQAQGWGLNDPAQLDAVAKELLELRKFRAEQEAKQTAASDDPSKKFVEAGLDPKQAAEVQRYLDKLGYVPKSVVEKLEKEMNDRFASLQQSTEQAREQQFEHQEATARQQLSGWLKDAKIDDPNGRRSQIIGSLIKDAIDSDDELVARWSAGGPDALALVREIYDAIIKDLGWTPAAASKTNYAASKTAALATNKKLPPPGTANQKTAPQAGARAKKDPWADMHERARAEFEKVIEGA